MMAPRLVLHALPGDKRAGVLAGLVEELFLAGSRVVVWVADDGRRDVLDDYLWTFRQLSFVPHCQWTPGMEPIDEPIVLVGEAADPAGARVLVIGDEIPPIDWVLRFDEVHDLIPPGAEGVSRTERWREAGLSVA